MLALDTAAPRTDAKERLEQLAREVIDDPAQLPSVMPEVAELASAALWVSRALFERDQILRDAFEDYVHALEQAEDFENDLLETYDIDPDLTGTGDENDLAVAEIAAERVTRSLQYLLHGPRQ